MSTITLNGVSSNTITGLLIQNLPPISKPRLRTQIEEIDGRDGDSVTALGYAAYDKTVKIGLHGNFDINEVISFFASSGDVVFSNEPEMFYRYAIYDQIDYSRLLRFREAEVKFHVQPFKLALAEVDPEETVITSQTQIEITNEGNTTGKPVVSLTGTGDVLLFLNGNQAFTVAFGNTESTITIDTSSMEATEGGVLANRKVTGNYDNAFLPVGTNILTWSGDLAAVSIQYPSRWI